MKRLTGIVAVFCLLLTGCATPTVSAQPYLDDLEQVLTLRATISTQYTDAMKTVLDYTRTPMPETLTEARMACVFAMEEIASIKEVESALTDDQRKAMAELGMNQADYTTPFRMQEYEKAVRLQNLSYLLYCLNEEPPFIDLAASLTEMNLAYENYDWQIEIAAVNILLADIPENALGTFRETFLPDLAALGGEDLKWETDRDVLEARADSVFDQIEVLIESLAQETGELYLQLLSEERDLQQELETAGVDLEDAEHLVSEIARLEGNAN